MTPPPLGTFPKIHPFWKGNASLINIDINIFKNDHIDINIFQNCRYIDILYRYIEKG